ncbi:MAG TPA: ATP-binding protein [Chthoniobacterales bacterium]|nr:ATP-binding protein [Chthoniobacterales bacterium]
MIATADSFDTFRCFAANSLFEGIRPDVLEDIRYEMKPIRFAEGAVIFEEGDPGDSLYLVGDGSVKISKTGRRGQQETLGFIQAGNFFGEMALFDGQARSAKATAAAPTLLASVDERTFQRILELAPSRLHMNFLRSVSERLRHVNQHFISEVMRTERVNLVGAMANSIIHDLKNPMCIVRSCSDMIATESNDPRIRELTAMTDKAVEGMLAMAQELLDYARGSAALKVETVTVWRLLDELNQQALQLLPGQNIQLVRRISYDGAIAVDVNRFTRVLCNIIKNAREAMPNGGILRLSTDLVHEQIVFRITDTGCGIPDEILPKLFEPFVTHGKSHGTGLGMAIAKSTIEDHGGKISVQSIVSRGTTVDIRIPAPAAASA